MRALLTVRLALPCDCICRLPLGYLKGEWEIPETLASNMGGGIPGTTHASALLMGCPCRGTSSHGCGSGLKHRQERLPVGVPAAMV